MLLKYPAEVYEVQKKKKWNKKVKAETITISLKRYSAKWVEKRKLIKNTRAELIYGLVFLLACIGAYLRGH